MKTNLQNELRSVALIMFAILIAAILAFALGACNTSKTKTVIEPGTDHKPGDPIGNSRPMKRLNIPLKDSLNDTIEIVSQVIEAKPLDYSKRPSYTRPETYEIIHIKCGGIDNYMVRLNGGTMWSDHYKTVAEAQREINKVAKRSYDKWVISGGLDF